MRLKSEFEARMTSAERVVEYAHVSVYFVREIFNYLYPS